MWMFTILRTVIYDQYIEHNNIKRVQPFEYKYIWRDRNTSFLKVCGRYDRARCSDNFNHKKVINRGYWYEFEIPKIKCRFLQENFDDFRRKILTIFL